MQKLEGILIDLGGVLCSVNEQAAWEAWEAHTGLPGESLRAEMYDRGLKEEIDRGLKQPPGIAMFLSFRFETALSLDDWKRIWTSSVQPDPEMDEFAYALAQHLPTALASTTDRLHHKALAEQLSCLERFKGQTVSYEIGYVKPEPRFYHHALEQLGTPAKTTLFIDDKEENVMGALEAGMPALRFTGLAKLRDDLKQFGLLF